MSIEVGLRAGASPRQRDDSKSRQRAAPRIIALSLALFTISGATSALVSGGQGWSARAAWSPWYALPLLAVLFMITEIFVVHLHVRGEAHTFSLVELPLSLGIFFASPACLIGARLLGAGCALIVHRRQGVLKLVFNLASFFSTTVLAVVIFRGLEPQRTHIDASVLLAGELAVLANAVASVVLVFTAISLSTENWRPSELSDGVRFGVVTCIFTSSLGIIAVIVVDAEPLLAWLLLIPAAGIYLANWAYTTQWRRQEGLEFLYTSTKLLHESSDLESGIIELLRNVRSGFRSAAAELIYFAEAPNAPLCIRVGPGDLVRSVQVLDEGHVLLIQLLESSRTPILLDPSSGRGSEFLDRHGYKDAIVVPLIGETRVIGGLVVADHLSEVVGYDAEDIRLSETLANHTAVALEKDRLQQSVETLRALERRLTFQATHDPLTDLANRTLFRARLADLAHQRRGTRGSVVFIDLDDFKAVNDSHGHAAGDALLLEVAARLRSCVTSSDTVARLGGDEFALLLADVTSFEQATEVVTRVLSALELPVPLADRGLNVRASIGISLVDPDTDPEAVMRNADTAMYTAKASGKHQFVTFTPSMHDAKTHRVHLQSGLRAAMERDELVVHFQPVVTLATDEVVGAEALVRWNHPTLGLVPPEKFLVVASESGLVGSIDMVVLDLACAWLSSMDASGLPIPWVSVNVSPSNFRQPRLIDRVQTTLEKFQLGPGRLHVEITEDLIAEEAGQAIEILRGLKDLGVGIALDDFGTGYSSLNYLRILPIDTLKIAKDFVDDLHSSPDQQALARAIVSLGRTLGKFIIAEGIERPEQLHVLRELGCDAGQGYFLGRPMDGDAMRQWLQRSTARRPGERRLDLIQTAM